MAWTKGEIAQRVAQDIQPGWAVNLGIGIPTLVAGYIGQKGVLLHSENGILGMGPRPEVGDEDPDLVDAGKQPVTVVVGGCFFDTLLSFSIIRGGHLDLAIMGAYQVSASGDIANWRLPRKQVGGIGGAADLAVGAQRVWLAMSHVAADGSPKLVEECTYTLTARGVVSRVYTDLGVIDLLETGPELVELAPDVTFEAMKAATGMKLSEGTKVWN